MTRIHLNNLDLNEGEMKEIKVGNTDKESILVVKYNNTYHALSNYCPHFGAPMSTGIVIDNIIKCPWHGASFDIITGECDIGPSIDGLNKYEIIEDNGQLIALVDKNTLQKGKRAEMTKRDPANETHFVILGGGPASLSAAETLRSSGFTGKISIYTDEGYYPYDRTNLSKWFPDNISKILLRSENFYKEHDIDLFFNSKAILVNNQQKKIKFKDGNSISYDKLLLATGASAYIPNIEGKDAENVFTIRNFNDINSIKSAVSKSKNICIIGANFIGMEMASNLKKLNPKANVVIIDKHETPFEKILGKEIGNALKKLHEKNDIKFISNNTPKKINSVNKLVESILLEDNEVIKSDLVLIATGITPNSDYLYTSLTKEKNFVICDAYLNTSDPNIFAAGDIISYPNINTGERHNFAHYVNAQQQGSIAALNMLDKKVIYNYVPFFWTRQWDKSLQFVGSSNFDEVFIDGDLENLTFIAYYIRNNEVIGLCAMNTPNAANIMYEALRNRIMITGKSIKEGMINLQKIEKLVKKVEIKCSKINCCKNKQSLI